MKKLLRHIAFLTSLSGAVFGGAREAQSFTAPLTQWIPSGNDFWSCALRCRHLGVDLHAPIDTSVKSVCSGTVVQALWRGNRGNYGGRVLVECDPIEPYGAFVALYGHLGRDTQDPRTDDIFVRTGQRVEEGQVLGRIGDSSENGGFIPHLHLGMFRGPFRNDYVCGRWRYAGYTALNYSESDSCYCAVLANLYDPAEVLGMKEPDLRILRGEVTPSRGEQNETEFRWRVMTSAARASVTAQVFIKNPAIPAQFPFPMTYSGGTAQTGYFFDFSKTLQNTGIYEYGFAVSTCADQVMETEYRNGPEVIVQCIRSIEVCDSLDNDCDSMTDEELFSRPCSSACGRGTEICSNGAWTCNAPEPQAEVCDRQDNDCDGLTDEELTRTCETACGSGTETCEYGNFTPCSAPRPQPEICDSIDNDCDGVTDPNCECIDQQTRPCGIDTGRCSQGTQTCLSGRWDRCIGAIEPASEVCNSEDDDCDGLTDEELTQSCRSQCGSGIETCENSRFTNCTAPQPQSEVCDSLDNDCNGIVDDNLNRPCSSVCGSGTETCVNGIWNACSARQPQPEICNGRDDDCDNAIDEDTTNACGTCGLVPVETCNGRDDDCDSQVDENLPLNSCGTCGPAPVEICDFVDNDCDNAIDEGLRNACGTCGPLGESCDGADNNCNSMIDENLTRPCVTACGNGVQVCETGRWSTCNGPSPSQEVCDSRDNDCNGVVDDNLTRQCSSACGSGTETCVNGSWSNCTAPQASQEICNARDDDCDSAVDEDLTQNCTQYCGKSGAQTCSNGSWSTCQDPNNPCCPEPVPPEVCDALDNDCDMLVDENLQEACANSCGNQGTRVCQNGAWSTCNAQACPPPPQKLQTPTLTSPSEEAIVEVWFATTAYTTLRWQSVPNATQYRLEVKYTGSNSLIVGEAVSGTSYNLRSAGSGPLSDLAPYGWQIEWKVRALAQGYTESDFSSPRHFYFSDPLNHILKCEEQACPVPGAHYLVTSEIYRGATPNRVTVQWVRGECLNDRSYQVTTYRYMSRYHRSSSANGCP